MAKVRYMRMFIIYFVMACNVSTAEVSQAEQDEIWRRAMAESAAVESRREEELKQSHAAYDRARAAAAEEVERQKVEQTAQNEAARNARVLRTYAVDLTRLPKRIGENFVVIDVVPKQWRGAWFRHFVINDQARVGVTASFTLGEASAVVQIDGNTPTVRLGPMFYFSSDAGEILYLPSLPTRGGVGVIMASTGNGLAFNLGKVLDDGRIQGLMETGFQRIGE